VKFFEHLFNVMLLIISTIGWYPHNTTTECNRQTDWQKESL